MAAALMMMVVAGLVMAAWVSLMSTRAQQVVYMEDALHRRLSLHNSQAIGRQLMLGSAYRAGSAQAGAWEGSLAGAGGRLWGGVRVGGWNTTPFQSSVDPSTSTTVFPYNAAGLSPDATFLESRRCAEAGAMGTEMDELDLYHFMKTACPPLRGDLFTVYRKPAGKQQELDVHTNNVSGHFGQCRIDGRLVVKHISSLFSASTVNPLQLPARCRSFYVPDDNSFLLLLGTSLAGARMPPSNMAGVPMTVGSVGAGVDLWQDELNVIQNNNHPDNSLWHFMDREATAGRNTVVEINSADAAHGGPTSAWWIEKQIPNDGVRAPKPGETLGVTYPTQATPLVTAGNGTWNVLFVRMDHPNLPNIRVVSGGVGGRIHQVVFRGQAPLSAAFNSAALLRPVIFLIVKRDSDLESPIQDVRFEQQNNRRWVLGVKSGVVNERLELNWEGATVTEGSPARAYHNWRLMLVNESREVFVNIRANQNTRLTGGVMTNWLFKRRRSASGFPRNEAWDALSFRLDANPDPTGAAAPKFTSLLPRDGWLESYVRLPMEGSAPVN